MKKILMATAAAAAVAGFSTLAMAQAGSPGNEHGSGAAMHRDGGSAMKPPSGQSAQQQQGVKVQDKSQERMGQSAEPNKAQRGAQEEQRGAEQKGAEQDNKTGVNANERNAGQAPEGRGGNAQLSQDQRSRIAAVVGKSSTARYDGNVDFTIRVGQAVPRRVHVEVLPQDIVEIVPQYRGFDYVLVGEQILIVDPRTLEIVAIIPA